MLALLAAQGRIAAALEGLLIYDKESCEVRRLKLVERARAKARAERLYFKEVIIPNRMREIEVEFTALLQEFAPGAEFRFGPEEDTTP